MNVKNLKKEIQSKENREEGSKQDLSAAPSRKPSEVMSFDAYFQKLMKMDPKVHIHHKAPMRHYAELKGLNQVATEEEFKQIFSQY